VPTNLLDTGYVTARLHLPEDVDLAAGTCVSAELPGGWLLSADYGSAADLPHLRVTPGREAAVTQRGTEPDDIGLCLPPDVLVSPRLAYVSYTLLEHERQRAGMVTLHGAAVVLPGNVGVLILGDKGSGKTNTLLALADQGGVPAGDDVIVLRLHDGQLDVLPSKRVAAVRGPMRPDAFHYETKQYVRLDAASEFLKHATPLTHVFRVNVHQGADSARLRQMTGLSVAERLRLHENLGRYLSGLATPLTVDATHVRGPVLALDDGQCARFRSRLIEHVGRCDFFYLQARDADEAAHLIRAACGT
jgi:hypothetical protein